MMENTVTLRFRVYGIVQGVGFRPTVARHAAAAGIRGNVCNKGPYVEILAQGNETELDCFRRLLREQPPRRAAILKIDEKRISGGRKAGVSDRARKDSIKRELPVFEKFSIIESEKTVGEIYISPDIAICEDCIREMYDPEDRRYLHPFINCTCCGPRLTILDALPYDRERTSMKMFPMCRPCAEEYHSPLSRRYDAQPVCCNDCGPQVFLLPLQKAEDKDVPDAGQTPGSVRGRAAITAARRTILRGGIVAVKGIGGFHLCCDAGNEEAVRLLRVRKHRPAKPFAVMMKNEQVVCRECELSEEQREILTGHQKPILLLKRRNTIPAGSTAAGPGSAGKCTAGTTKQTMEPGSTAASPPPAEKSVAGITIAPSVAPGNPKVGVMLPYAPLQLLLFEYDDGLEMPDCLVMTSGNVSGAPICRDDVDALAELSAYCDCILSHDRLIRIRADDSVMDFHNGHPYMIRRSRGYAPLPVLLSEEWTACPDSSRRMALGSQEGPALSGERTACPEFSQRSVRGSEESPALSGERAACPDSSRQLVLGSQESPALSEERKEDREKPRGEALSCVLAIGGELKNTFCIASGSLYYLSPYIGDLEDLRTVRALRETIGRMETLLEAAPQAVVCDLHPGYHSTEVAEEIARQRNIPLYRIQHHYAHVLSCMAENDHPAPVIGVAFDGTGYGTDGTIWGGEILTADTRGFSRVYSIAPFTQIGGDSASRQGWRIAVSMILDLCKKIYPEKEKEPDTGEKLISKNGTEEAIRKTNSPENRTEELIREINSPESGEDRAYGNSRLPEDGSCSDIRSFLRADTPEEAYPEILQRLSICDPPDAKVQRRMAEKGIRTITSTSAGRLFDAVSAMLGICRESTYEGEASIELEFAAERFLKKKPEPGTEYFPLDGRCLPTDRLFAALLAKRLAGEDPEQLAFVFHDALSAMITEAVLRTAEKTGLRTAALTGGCFQNSLLLSLTEKRLQRAGMKVLIHHLVPPNDGGIALGQAAAVLAGPPEC